MKEENKNIEGKVVSGMFWRLLERFAAQGVQMVLTIVLARLLSPADYGMISLVMVFISLANILAHNGLGQALIQNINSDQKDFSSAFYFSFFVSLVMYGVLYLTAPIVSSFYDMNITSIIRVLSVMVIIGGVNSIQQAYVAKKMIFKKFFWSTLGGTVASAIIGIILAYKGFGVWALVVQQITNLFFDTLILWFTVSWRPTKQFSFNSVRNLYQYGWKLLISGLLNTGFDNVYALIIGKAYTSEELGYYNRGKQYPEFIVSNVNSAMDSVLFSAFSHEQNDKDKVKELMKEMLSISTFIIFPMMSGLIAISNNIITILLTEKWIKCVPFLAFSSIYYALWPIHTINLQVIKSMGRSDIFLKLEIAKKIVSMVILAFSFQYGILGMMIGMCISGLIGTAINSYPNKKLINYGYLEQIKSIYKNFCLATIMGGVVWIMRNVVQYTIVACCVQIIAGTLLYLLLSYLFNRSVLNKIFFLFKISRS